MSETPTGTDRVELTEDERAQMNCGCHPRLTRGHADTCFVPVAESIVAARLQALTAERERLAEKVGRLLEVSQELCAERDAARTEADELRREIQAVAGGALVEEAETSVRRIHAEVERDVARQALTSADAMNRHWDEINAERDRLQAELVAANARCADYENGISWGTSCISCAKTLDSSYAEYVRAEALQATLDRVTALADDLESGKGWGPGEVEPSDVGYVLRAALTPEGKS